MLAMRDRDRANMNEIEIVVFSVTSNDFPHHMLLLTFVPTRSAARTTSGQGGLAVNCRAGPSGHTNSPHPSSREGQHRCT